MHMADALLSPVVGGGFWIASGALIGYSVKKITEEGDNSKTALMGVLGAFVFAVQMINFTIPGTGSSGHLGGGLLLAALLGPHRAFITLVSVLVMQSLFFADGGVLALGCNIFNLAFLPAYIAYPFLYRPLAGNATSGGRMAAASITAATAGMVMGSFFVVAETALSAITELPFTLFLLFMLPIHLAIGIVEGLVTWGVLAFIARTEPGLLVVATKKTARPRLVAALFTVAALLIGGCGSWFASSQPDGLEWSVAKVAGSTAFSASHNPLHEMLASLQQKTAFLPDYGFKPESELSSTVRSPVNVGSSVSAIVGTLFLLVATGVAGMVVGRKGALRKP